MESESPQQPEEASPLQPKSGVEKSQPAGQTEAPELGEMSKLTEDIAIKPDAIGMRLFSSF